MAELCEKMMATMLDMEASRDLTTEEGVVKAYMDKAGHAVYELLAQDMRARAKGLLG